MSLETIRTKIVPPGYYCRCAVRSISERPMVSKSSGMDICPAMKPSRRIFAGDGASSGDFDKRLGRLGDNKWIPLGGLIYQL